MIERKKITYLLRNHAIVKIERDKDRPGYLHFKNLQGKTYFMVHEDQIFDGNGFHFEIDVK